MGKIECQIIYREGEQETKAKFSFVLKRTTPIIENPKTSNAAVVTEGGTFETNINYKKLKELQDNLPENE